jgi:monoamine oxidase
MHLPTFLRFAAARMSHVDDRVRVLVVGAGLAGLRCADLLQRSGVTVELHEASERLGAGAGVPTASQTVSSPSTAGS